MVTALQLLLCAVITILMSDFCHGLAEFVQFPGFDVPLNKTHTTTDTIETNTTTTITNKTKSRKLTKELLFYKTAGDSPDPTNIANSAEVEKVHMHLENATSTSNHTSNSTTLHPRPMSVTCLEEDHPTNIGPYEVPTQRDLVNHIKSKLLKIFNKYHKKALYLLKDIKEATRATAEVELKCPTARRLTYKKCVQHVMKQCKVITKSLVTSLEYQRHDVTALTEDNICNMTAMKTDPVELIKVVAMEEASLEFALPGFLRLLSACSYYCNVSNNSTDPNLRPTRHLTDQELVVKHFLTRKNYVQLIRATP